MWLYVVDFLRDQSNWCFCITYMLFFYIHSYFVHMRVSVHVCVCVQTTSYSRVPSNWPHQQTSLTDVLRRKSIVPSTYNVHAVCWLFYKKRYSHRQTKHTRNDNLNTFCSILLDHKAFTTQLKKQTRKKPLFLRGWIIICIYKKRTLHDRSTKIIS